MLDYIFRPMDFKGQRLAEQLLIRIIVLFAAVGFLAGYISSSFQLMVQINAVGLALVALLVLPPWPWYSRAPLQWLPPLHPVKP